MPVWRYMELCLTIPTGDYVARDPLGARGRFHHLAGSRQNVSANCSGCGQRRCGKVGSIAVGAAAYRTRARRGTMIGGCAARAAGVAAALSIAQRPLSRSIRAAQQAEIDACGGAQYACPLALDERARTFHSLIPPTSISMLCRIHRLKREVRMARARGRNRRAMASGVRHRR